MKAVLFGAAFFILLAFVSPFKPVKPPSLGAPAGLARVLRIKPAFAVLPLAGFDPSPLRV